MDRWSVHPLSVAFLRPSGGIVTTMCSLSSLFWASIKSLTIWNSFFFSNTIYQSWLRKLRINNLTCPRRPTFPCAAIYATWYCIFKYKGVFAQISLQFSLLFLTTHLTCQHCQRTDWTVTFLQIPLNYLDISFIALTNLHLMVCVSTLKKPCL